MPRRPPTRDDRRPLLEALEPRILLSADVDAALLGGALLDPGGDAVAEVVLLEDGEEVAQTGSVVERRQEIVFVDSGLEDHGALVDALRSARPDGRDLEVVLIDAEESGIDQITDVLSDHQDLDAIHIVSHGAEAAVQLGNSWLMAENLDAHAGSLLAWSDALAEDADLLFYGCNLAGGEEGAAFAESLAKLTGADVAASTDATGSALLGGDLQLEHEVGAVEASLAIGSELQHVFSELLVNAPPVNAVPSTQTTDVDTPLLFSEGSGNGISVSDPDAGTHEIEITLQATHGTLTITGSSDPVDVNTPSLTEQEAPRIARNDAGDTVVVWQSKDQDGDSWGIYAQRYDAAGNAIGSEFRVNTTTSKEQAAPATAIADDGSFVVAWQSLDQDGDSWGIYAQRYDASGGMQGSEFRVNTTTGKEQTSPDVAMDDGGRFVVAWQSLDQDGDSWGVYAQRYDAAGNTAGSEFRVNATTSKEQTSPSIAIADDGSFVVAWQSLDQDGDSWGIYAQSYDASGGTQGSELRINTETSKEQASPDVAMDANGDFVVVWQSLDQDGGNWGIFAQRYDSGGSTQGSEFQVNTTTNSRQSSPAVAMDQDGDFIVVWEGLPGSVDIMAQRYDAAGNPLGGEFQASAGASGSQSSPDVAMDADGDYFVVWQGKTPSDTDGLGGRGFHFPKSLTFVTGDGIDESTIVVRGKIDDLNDALDGLTFTPGPGFTGTASIDITTDDLGNTGGPAETDSDKVFVIVGTPTNQAPTLDSSGDLRLSDVGEDASDPAGDTVADLLASGGGTPISDADTGALQGIAVVAVDDSHGTWQFSIDGDTTWTDFGSVGDASAVLLDTAASLRFVPAPDYAGPAGDLTFRAWDQTTGSNGQTGVDTSGHGGASAFSSDTETTTLDVLPVNDAPVNQLPGDQIVEQGGTLILSQSGGNAISVHDAEAGVVRLTLEVSEGALSLADISGLHFDSGDGTADATMAFTGSLSAINAALDGLTYEAAPDSSGVVTLRVQSDDLGGVGAGGPLASESLLSISVIGDVLPDLDDDGGDPDPDPPEEGEEPEDEDEAAPESDGGVSEAAPNAVAAPLMPIDLDPARAGADRTTPALPRAELDGDPDSSNTDESGPGIVQLSAAEDGQDLGGGERRTPQHHTQTSTGGALYEALDQLRERMAREADLAETPEHSMFASVRAMALVASTGFLTALLRGGSLLALTFSSLPLWNGFDPLAVLALTREEREKRKEELREARRAEDRGAAGLGDLLDEHAIPDGDAAADTESVSIRGGGEVGR